MNIASRDVHGITHSTLYETVVFDRDPGPDGASWLRNSAFKAGDTRWRYTKYVLQDLNPDVILISYAPDSYSCERTTPNDSRGSLADSDERMTTRTRTFCAQSFQTFSFTWNGKCRVHLCPGKPHCSNYTGPFKRRFCTISSRRFAFELSSRDGIPYRNP
jgi:hypothetical protein